MWSPHLIAMRVRDRGVWYLIQAGFPVDAFGPFLAVGIPLVTGAFMWLFYRELLMSESFWIVLIALAIAATAAQSGHTREGAAIAAVGIVVWLWLEYRRRGDAE
jgi:hypothetical protein